MNETVAFVLCIEHNAIRDQALLLIESIRTFTGAHKDSEIIAISPRGNGVDPATQWRLREQRVRYIDLLLNQACPQYGSANRIYAAAWAAQNSSASTLIVLDSDTVFFGEPELLGTDFAVAARPIDLKYASSTGPGDALEDYIEAMCALAGETIEVLPYIESTLDRARIRASYNGGYLAVRRDSGILELSADLFSRSVDQGLRPREGGKEVFASTGWVGPAASEYWSSNQTATAVAIWSTGQKVRELNRRYNVPLHLLAKENDLSEWSGVDPLHIHYHWMLNAQHRPQTLELLAALGVAPDKRDWLAERSPLS